MNPNYRDLVERQYALEAEAIALGQTRYRAERPMPWRDAASYMKEESDLIPGRHLVRQSVLPVADAIRSYIEDVDAGRATRNPGCATLLKRLGAEEAAFLAIRVMLNACGEQAAMTTTAIAISDALVDHIEMRDFKKARPAQAKGVIKLQSRSGYSRKKRKNLRAIIADAGLDHEVTKVERTRTGVKLIELICDVTGFFEIINERSGGRTKYVVKPTGEVLSWLEDQHGRCELLMPLNMPMIVRPRRWTSPFSGGYLTQRPGQRLVKHRVGSYAQAISDADMPKVYSAINAIQDTAWRINRPVFEVMKEVWDSGGSLGDLPRHADVPLPARPDSFDTDKHAAQTWKMAAANVYSANKRLSSRRIAMSQRIWIADRFKDEQAIYFPHSLDFRGRVYPLPTGGPQPQGDDTSRALLEFAEGKPITDLGAAWLMVHLANRFGIDKVSFDERRQWVFDNMDALLDSADRPLDGHRFWTQADDPWQALAACMDLAGYMREGPSWVSYLPVNLDGSNSGLQHYSALLRDPVGARAVNLTPGLAPADLYNEVAARVQTMADASEDPMAASWQGGNVTRSVVKRPAMTFVYSATRYGFQDQVMTDIGGSPTEAREVAHAARWISYALWDAIGETVVAASEAMDWLKTVARLFNDAALPIWWTSPIGLPVYQCYLSHKVGRVKCFIGGRRVELHLRVEEPTLDGRSMVNAISPNFVHSLDASHLMAVVNRCHDDGLTSLSLIHDSFGAHACDAQQLVTILRDTFVEQYRPDVLARFRDEIAAQLPPELADQIPPLPAMGSLDIESIRGSDYLFH